MDIKDIIAVVRPDGRDHAAVTLAAELAAARRARLTGLCLLPMPAIAAADCYAVGRSAMDDVLSRMEQDTEAMAQTAEAAFRHAAETAGCDILWERTAPAEVCVETAMRARNADLVVMRRPAAEDGAGCRLAEAFIRFGGAPCLLAPNMARPPARLDRIAIGWNGSHEAKRAVDDALPLLRTAKHVEILTVGPPADAPAPPPAALAARLERHGVSAAQLVHLDRSHDGRAAVLLRHCAAHDIDLLVMGALGRPARTEQWLGGTTWSAMTTAGLPVFLSR